MHHIAIMRKSWGLLEKIITGEKTAESRWFKTTRPPWNKVKPGDTLWFKNSGKPVTVKTRVTKVLQFENLTAEKTREILEKYGERDMGVKFEAQNTNSEGNSNTENIKSKNEIDRYFTDKNYCVIVFFDRVEKVKPFNINKAGFGAMSAWICVDSVKKIIQKSILVNSVEKVLN